VLRSYMRHRQMRIESAAAHVQHMQKAMTQMNLQLQHVISDITGATGMRIIRAIVAGQRDRQQLAALRDIRTKADEQTIAKALEGDYRPEHVFALQQSLELFDFYQKQISETDRQIADHLRRMESKVEHGQQSLGAGTPQEPEAAKPPAMERSRRSIPD
jgi:transposase